MTKSNDWDEFPNVLAIQSANAFQSKRDATRFYGNYLLKKDENDMPFYESDAPTAQNTEKYCLRYLKKEDDPQYNGWVMTVDKAKDFKYDLIQSRALSPSYLPSNIAGADDSENDVADTENADTQITVADVVDAEVADIGVTNTDVAGTVVTTTCTAIDASPQSFLETDDPLTMLALKSQKFCGVLTVWSV